MNYVERVDLYCRGMEHVSPGTCHSCTECQTLWGMDAPALEAALDKGAVSDEGGFSWQQCDTCGCRYGGNRYDAHGFDKSGNIVHLSVCADCVCYLSNGDIPKGE